MRVSIKNYRCFPQGATLDLSSYFTAIVGANNSGKSSLLRLLYDLRPSINNLMIIGTDHMFSTLSGRGVPLNYPGDSTELFSRYSAGDIEIEIQIDLENYKFVNEYATPDCFGIVISRLHHTLTTYVTRQGRPFGPPPGDVSASQNATSTYLTHTGNGKLWADLSPIIQSLSLVKNSIYIASFRNAINSGGSNYFDIEVGNAFIQRYRDWSSGPRVADREAALRLQQIIRSMFGYSEFTMSASANADNLICTIDGKSYSLSDQGSGLAQFALVLSNVAVKKPSCIFIDEPELNLHASLQRDFLLALALFSPKVVFATHSLGLALSDADRIYSVRRLSQGVSEVHEYGHTPRLSEFAGELSYSGYRELGFDSILLVEGPTEVKAFRHFLKLYGKDHKFVLVQLGGSSMINGKRKEELAEMLQICNKVSAVVDSDRTAVGGAAKKEAIAFESVCKSLNIRCLVTKYGATENYLTDAAVKAELGVAKAAIGPYQKLDERADWKKDINWKIARHMTKADIDMTDLGQFLAGL